MEGGGGVWAVGGVVTVLKETIDVYAFSKNTKSWVNGKGSLAPSVSPKEQLRSRIRLRAPGLTPWTWTDHFLSALSLIYLYTRYHTVSPILLSPP